MGRWDLGDLRLTKASDRFSCFHLQYRSKTEYGIKIKSRTENFTLFSLDTLHATRTTSKTRPGFLHIYILKGLRGTKPYQRVCGHSLGVSK